MSKTGRIYGEKTRQLLSMNLSTVTWRDLNDRPDRNKAFLHYLSRVGKLELVRKGEMGAHPRPAVYKIKVGVK